MEGSVFNVAHTNQFIGRAVKVPPLTFQIVDRQPEHFKTMVNLGVNRPTVKSLYVFPFEVFTQVSATALVSIVIGVVVVPNLVGCCVLLFVGLIPLL